MSFGSEVTTDASLEDQSKITKARYGTAARLWGKRIDVSGRITNQISVANAKCQKCLEKGHWTYQCQGQRKIPERPTRSKQYEVDVKRLKSGLPLVPDSNQSRHQSSAFSYDPLKDPKEAGALARLKAALDEDSSSDSDGNSSSSSSSLTSRSRSRSASSSSSSSSASSSSSSDSEKSKKKKLKKKGKKSSK